MKPRSALPGYNHNVRYARRLFHVQTEDSGVHSPHIYTHLFFGGTILATKRADYEAEAQPATVQKTMQAMHKAMLLDLRSGRIDAALEKFFGEKMVPDGGVEPADSARRTEPGAAQATGGPPDAAAGGVKRDSAVRRAVASAMSEATSTVDVDVDVDVHVEVDVDVDMDLDGGAQEAPPAATVARPASAAATPVTAATPLAATGASPGAVRSSLAAKAVPSRGVAPPVQPVPPPRAPSPSPAVSPSAPVARSAASGAGPAASPAAPRVPSPTPPPIPASLRPAPRAPAPAATASAPLRAGSPGRAPAPPPPAARPPAAHSSPAHSPAAHSPPAHSPAAHSVPAHSVPAHSPPAHAPAAPRRAALWPSLAAFDAALDDEGHAGVAGSDSAAAGGMALHAADAPADPRPYGDRDRYPRWPRRSVTPAEPREAVVARPTVIVAAPPRPGAGGYRPAPALAPIAAGPLRHAALPQCPLPRRPLATTLRPIAGPGEGHRNPVAPSAPPVVGAAAVSPGAPSATRRDPAGRLPTGSHTTIFGETVDRHRTALPIDDAILRYLAEELDPPST